jgi:hypothetical protein
MKNMNKFAYVMESISSESELPIDSRGQFAVAAGGRTPHRAGLTLLEVIFAMGIILFGLVGIGLLVPYAARQANESQTITFNLANGMSASAMTKSSSLLVPSEESPWQLIEDTNPGVGDSNRTVFTSFRDLYSGRDRFAGTNPPFSIYRQLFLNTLDFPSSHTNPQSQDHAWININRAIGTCFYLDPNFLGAQAYVSTSKVLRNDWAPFRRNRFPYYAEDFRPSPLTTGVTPRLTRISLRDSNTPAGMPLNGWMKASVARLLTSSYGGEIDQFPQSNNVGVPVRSIMTSEDLTNVNHVPELIRTATGSSRFGGSWAIMICPDEETPIIPKSQVRMPVGQTDYLSYTAPVFPEMYNVSIVLYGKRNVAELTPGSSLVNGFATGEVLPEAEKLATATAVNNQSMTSGNFEIVLTANTALDAKINAGDWIMLSRNVIHFETPPLTGVYVMRQRHRWYRVVSAPSSTSFPLTVRISGTPWDWTNDEIRSAKEANVANFITRNPIDPTSPYYALTQTTATIVPNVTHVFQRTYDLGR